MKYQPRISVAHFSYYVDYACNIWFKSIDKFKRKLIYEICMRTRKRVSPNKVKFAVHCKIQV